MKPFENALPGFNHNVKHKGQLYHIQTEDSGRHNPTVTTLLFLGGNILASLKLSYAEHLQTQTEELPKRVRELMEAQHKQMLRNLLKGQYDKKQEANSKHWKVGQLDDADDAPLLADAVIQADTQYLTLLPSAHLNSAPLNSAPLNSAPLNSAPLNDIAPPALLAASASPLAAVPPASMPQTQPFEDETAGAIFGEDLVSEKRLDELILNYLLREKDKLD